MNYRLICRALATAAFVIFAAMAATAHDVNITSQAKLGNGPEIKPGTYRLELLKNQENPEAAFYQGGELVAKVPVTIVAESEKSRQTEVHYETLDSGVVINQIRVAGWKERLVFRDGMQQSEVAE